MSKLATVLFAATGLVVGHPHPDPLPGAAVRAKLTEWTVQLSESSIPAGKITFTVANAGNIPHGFEVEGRGIEREIEKIEPGAVATLTLELKPGNYEVYCPVGGESHKKLGMMTHLRVVASTPASPAGPGHSVESTPTDPDAKVQSIRVTGAGPVIQILPGPFAFPDSAAPILKAFGDEREGLESQSLNGPYSNNVARTVGTFKFVAWDKGAVKDSVDGVAEFATGDSTRWRLVIDRVQTRDVPHHPRFGGVILGLYYHGNTGVHTPLVPTINSAVALWAVGHLYENGTLVTDNAQVHVMLVSRTRRATDFTLACWDCSKQPVEELQLQVLPGPGEPKFDAPGGFLFLNWEKSSGRTPAN